MKHRQWCAAVLTGGLLLAGQAAAQESQRRADLEEKNKSLQATVEALQKENRELKERLKKGTTLTADQEYALLEKEYQAASEEFARPWRTAKSDEERAKIRPDYSKHPNRTYVAKFQAFAEKHKKTSAAVKALVFVCQHGQGGGGFLGASPAQKAMAQVREDHMTDPQLASALGSLQYLSGATDFYRALLEKSPHRSVKGLACYYLAKSLERGMLAKAREQEIVSLLERVEKEFADVSLYPGATDPRYQLGAAAKRDLFEFRFLSIGKVAPQIEGEDIDGATFKLTEYRGKVVVLDFWGDW